MNASQGFPGTPSQGGIGEQGYQKYNGIVQGSNGPVGRFEMTGGTRLLGFQGDLGPTGAIGVNTYMPTFACEKHKFDNKYKCTASQATRIQMAVVKSRYDDIVRYVEDFGDLPCFMLDCATNQDMVTFLQDYGCCCMSPSRCALTQFLLNCVTFVPEVRSEDDIKLSLDDAVRLGFAHVVSNLIASGHAKSNLQSSYWRDFIVQNYCTKEMSACLKVWLQSIQVLPNSLIDIVVEFLRSWDHHVHDVFLVKNMTPHFSNNIS